MTASNVDDRQALPQLCVSGKISGTLLGDQGYLGASWKKQMMKLEVDLITRVRRNMTPQLLDPFDDAVLRKRGVVEGI